MAKVKQFEKVLKVIVDANGQAVSKDDIIAKLGKEIVPNRIPTYMWEIKVKAQVPIATLKNGRKVTGYFIENVSAKPASVKAEDSEIVIDDVESKAV